MARGEQEQKCFDRIKKHVNNSECLFGLSENDRDFLLRMFEETIPNPSLSEFPDFIFEEGYIEHFQITSSKMSRKGSKHKKEEQEFYRTVEKDVAELQCEWNNNPDFENVRSQTWTHNNPEHSYQNLVDSFKRNWESHIRSAQKYLGCKKNGVFLIEYSEIALSMYENMYTGWPSGLSNGDMRYPEKHTLYRLSRDKNLLRYIYDYKDIIQYVVFVNNQNCEIIKTENVQHLIRLIPWDFSIYPLSVTAVSTIYCVSIDNNFQKGENND